MSELSTLFHLIAPSAKVLLSVMNINQYIEEKYELYDEFSAHIESVLRAITSEDDRCMGVQNVEHRAKSPVSLSKKLKDRNIYDANDVDAQIKDLSGCRLIFYHNEDVITFLDQGF